MAIQIVMDRTGDSRHPFNPNDAQELATAGQRFYELTKVGFTAAVRTGPGQVSRIRSFHPNAVETVLLPRLGCGSPPAAGRRSSRTSGPAVARANEQCHA